VDWGGEGRGNLGGFELHQRAPFAADLAEIGRAVLDAASDGVVCAGEEAFGLELDIGVQVLRVVAGCAGVAELDDHLSEEDAAGIHVWHRYHVFCGERVLAARERNVPPTHLRLPDAP
jgi:hypothetical protein